MIMNKKLFGAFCLAIACAGAITFTKHYVSESKFSASPLIMENVEALSEPDVSTNNTGPAKLKKCAGHAGTRKFCMCENTNPCQESSCQ